MSTTLRAEILKLAAGNPRLAEAISFQRSHIERGCAPDLRAIEVCTCSCEDHQCDRLRAEEGQDSCPECGGAGVVRVDRPLGHPRFGKGEPCPGCHDAAELEWLEVQRQSHGSIPLECEGFTIAALRDDRPPKAEILSYLEQPSPPLFSVLCGPTGTGKTHGAVALAREIAALRDISIWFTETTPFLDELRACYDSTDRLEDVERPLLRAGILVLDDVGAENQTAWVQERLFRIINARYMGRQATVVTTNVTPQTAPRSRLWSRIFGERGSFVIPCNGPDLRMSG